MYVKSDSEEPKYPCFVSLIKLLGMSIMRGIYWQRQLCYQVKGKQRVGGKRIQRTDYGYISKIQYAHLQCSLKFMRNGTALPAVKGGKGVNSIRAFMRQKQITDQ